MALEQRVASLETDLVESRDRLIGAIDSLRSEMRSEMGGLRSEPELPISSCLDPSNAPSSTRAIVVSLTDAVNHPIKLTKPSLGVVS